MDFYRNRNGNRDRAITRASDHKETTDSCVCDVVKKIVMAQDEVMNDCSTCCEQSIRELQGKGNRMGHKNTTIPFILYAKGTSEPFIGSGIFKTPGNKHKESFFGCIETPVFRAKRFIKNSDCCVTLELLLPASDDCEIKYHQCDNNGRVCSFFPENDPVTDFIATGICLTVDLDHFVGITCLDPIDPI